MNTPLQSLFEQGLKKLQALGEPFALCGALATIPYYSTPRATNDIDFVIGNQAPDKAISVIKELSLAPNPLTRAELDGGPQFAIKNKSSPVAVVIGKDPKNKDGIGFDILLPSNIWVPSAVERAQNNVLNILGHDVPVITKEDLLLSKLLTYSKRPDRKNDLLDIRMILSAEIQTLDLEYLNERAMKYALTKSDLLLGKVSPAEKQLLDRIYPSKENHRSKDRGRNV